MQILTIQFKEQVFTTTKNLLKEKYIMKNVKKHRELKKYAQKIIKCAKSTKMKSIFNQLNIIYNDINVELRKVLRKSFNTIILNIFLQNFDECKNI